MPGDKNDDQSRVVTPYNALNKYKADAIVRIAIVMEVLQDLLPLQYEISLQQVSDDQIPILILLLGS